jgi:2-polyprenyl-3-methyl-5-hydroxy-6-metoxy-1,4-benzoquinol methylase
MPSLKTLRPEEFGPVLEDLGLAAEDVVVVDPAPPPPSARGGLPKLGTGPLLVGQIGGGLEAAVACARYKERADASLPADAPALFFLKDARTDGELARWRSALWPWLHLLRVYRIAGGAVEREVLQGREVLSGRCERDGVILVGMRREHVLSPGFTVEKFDANAAGWNGRPGEPGYAHFRWMRRYVGRYAQPVAGERILDFGCGAGWVGIEASLAAGRAPLRAFDPSPQMIAQAEENARANGIEDFAAATGFGEQPPFPREGEAPFDLVISSGVVSFSPDAGRWVDGLVSTVRPGGRLVVGDINRGAKGMIRRRKRKVLLPAREMNALTAGEMLALLEQRGFVCEAYGGYQLTWPVPQLMHASDTRLGGVLTGPLLALNKLKAGGLRLAAFDSWVVKLRAPE